MSLDFSDVKAAAERIRGHVRPIHLVDADSDAFPGIQVVLAMEFMQHTGSFKARGAANFLAAHREAGTIPQRGITIASGGNAGLACAWAARQDNIPATVFLPATAPRVKVDRLVGLGADVELIGDTYAEAARACAAFAEREGALRSHAYDHPLIAAGAGTLALEILDNIVLADTIIVSVGGGGLLSGIATVASEHSIQTIAVEPRNCRALNAAIEADDVVDVDIDSIAADSLGATRTSQMALDTARAGGVTSVLVEDDAIIGARQALWDHRRLAVEHGAATALAALTSGAYTPQPEESVVVVLCGANTDPGDLVSGGRR